MENWLDSNIRESINGAWPIHRPILLSFFLVFITSYMNCIKSQEIDLTQHFSEKHLDSAPEIQVCSSHQNLAIQYKRSLNAFHQIKQNKNLQHAFGYSKICPKEHRKVNHHIPHYVEIKGLLRKRIQNSQIMLSEYNIIVTLLSLIFLKIIPVFKC